jgi:hypothetical protein
MLAEALNPDVDDGAGAGGEVRRARKGCAGRANHPPPPPNASGAAASAGPPWPCRARSPHSNPSCSPRPRQVGWEEQAEAAATHLLRGPLARDARDAAVPVPPLAAAPDTRRLRKHWALVAERLAKGARPGGAGAARAAAAAADEQRRMGAGAV